MIPNIDLSNVNSLMDRGSKVLIDNSKSQKYLMCTENPIIDEAKELQKKISRL